VAEVEAAGAVGLGIDSGIPAVFASEFFVSEPPQPTSATLASKDIAARRIIRSFENHKSQTQHCMSRPEFTLEMHVLATYPAMVAF
jgi:hypothetical protein